MAQKPKSDNSTRTFLLAGMVCLFLGLSWVAYECLRPETEEEAKKRKEDEKVNAEIARKNAPKTGP